MAETGNATAFGKPGMAPRWTRADKEGVGTAYSASSCVWYTLSRGHLTEIYYPTIDCAQVRDLQYLISDGETFFQDEARDLISRSTRMCPSLGYEIESRDPKRRYQIHKTVIADPHLPCVLQRTRVSAASDLLKRLKLYALCAPHLGGRGMGNSGRVLCVSGRHILVAGAGGHWLALGATVPFSRASVGYVGFSDGWTDLSQNCRMDWKFEEANDGNVALTGEIELADAQEFTLGLAFGGSCHGAVTTLLQSLALPFADQLKRFQTQWERAIEARLPLEKYSHDGGNLYRASFSLLVAHEDKIFQGANPASLSIPWGEARGDEDGSGGYHLVWTRDLVQCATGLLAGGQTSIPLRTLIYLAVLQLPNGGFPQNMWVDGRPFRSAMQLDQVAFPILLARRLKMDEASSGFDPNVMVRRSARCLVLQGPVTEQERWEEASGYSPSTLAAIIAGVVCAASFASEAGDDEGAAFVNDYADWLRAHIEEWTVTTTGTLAPGIKRHFVRLNPVAPGAVASPGSVDHAVMSLSSQAPQARKQYPAREIVDAGFLVLVRHGILAPDDPLVIDSLRVVDQELKVQTPPGISWRRYSHDGYGQREDGGPYVTHGIGRCWPLLTGERAHYELAAGRDPGELIEALEHFASGTGLLPEQIWDEGDIPEAHMRTGYATGSAAPLLWAHAEYIKVLRSVKDGVAFGQFKAVTDRYLRPNRRPAPPEFWSFRHPTSHVPSGCTLRLCAEHAFRLRISLDDWQSHEDLNSRCTYDIHFADISISADQRVPIRFTFFWPEGQRWEGRDMQVQIVERTAATT